MKKIIISLSLISLVAVAVIGVTRAYFSDTETSTGNTLTAGTIDISVDGQNPWTKNYSLGDLKPGESKTLTLNVKNEGANAVNVYKKIYNMAGTGGSDNYNCSLINPAWVNSASSEPECQAEAGTAVDNIQSQIIYDLSVEVYNSLDVKTWWQTIYTDSQNKKLSDVYVNDSYVSLGMIPVGGHMLVKQSYHFDSAAGNEYQGDTLTFDMEIKGEQLAGTGNEEGYASVTLAQKNQGENNEWAIVENGPHGTLSYQTVGPKFKYDFSANGLTDGSYQLVYYPDPWTSPKMVTLIGGTLTASGGSISVTDQEFELGKDLPETTDANYPGAKIWLVPTSSLSGNELSWTNVSNFLFDTAFITYDDTDL